MIQRPKTPLKVLIIEDEALLVMDIESVIMDAGHHVLNDVASVDELELLELQVAPDLVLVDLNLAQGTSGLDASTIVRKRWIDSFIVFVTANPGKIPEGHAGAHGVIAKPFTQKGLNSALVYICQGICTPPPEAPLPGSFVSFPAFEQSWAG